MSCSCPFPKTRHLLLCFLLLCTRANILPPPATNSGWIFFLYAASRCLYIVAFRWWSQWSVRLACLLAVRRTLQILPRDALRSAVLCPNSTYSICCGFVVQKVVQQIHNKSTTNRSPTTNPQHLDMSRCCGFVVQQFRVHNKSTTNRSNGVWIRFVVDLL